MRIASFGKTASDRLRTITLDARIWTAARALADARAGLVVVCGGGGEAAGVISKSDLVRHLARSGRADADAAAIMTRTIVSCHPEDELQAVWREMTARNLQNMPILGAESQPLGVLDIRDALRAILEAEQLEEQALANYIAGIGYR